MANSDNVAPTLTLTIDRSQGHALVRVIEEGVDELSCYTGAPAGDGALEDAADELIHQLRPTTG